MSQISFSMTKDIQQPENDIVKRFEEIIAKHGLPSFEELDKEFEIGTVEMPCAFLSRAIRMKIIERIDSYAKFLDEFLYHPDNSYATMYELKAFTEADREKLFDLFGKLMLVDRINMELNLELSEEKDIEFIKRVFHSWAEMKKDLLEMARKMRKVWETDRKDDEIISYFG